MRKEKMERKRKEKMKKKMKRDKDGTNKRRECGWIRKKKRKEKKRKERRKRKQRREREGGERNKKGDFLGIPMVESYRFESKSRSTHCRLRVGTKILEFCQTP